MSDPSESVKKDEPKVEAKDLPVFPSASAEPGGGEPAIDGKPRVQDKRL